MSNRKNPKVYVLHVLDCIESIQRYTKGFLKNDFLKSKLVQDAVIRNLEVIGEAVKQINDDVRAENPTVEWKKISGLRDILIHNYLGG